MGKELHVTPFEIGQIQEIMNMAKNSELQSFFPLQRYANSDYLNYLKFEITKVLACRDNKAFTVQGMDKYLGFASLSEKKWDEQIFGIKIAAVPHFISIGDYPSRAQVLAHLLNRIIEECAQENVRLVYARVNSSDLPAVHALEKKGFLLMDTITTKYTITKEWGNYNADSAYRIRQCESKDIDKVKELARLGFQDYVDRFHLDPHLNNRDSDNLYAEWAVNSCNGYADVVFLAEDNSKIVGFATCKLYGDIEKCIGLKVGEIELITTAPDSRGKGVFSHLIENCMKWFLDKADYVIYKTQIRNIKVQRILQKYGFETESYLHTFHKWLSSD
jgi:dTDP-4-amino-4,6-dideoxy-D-galactose acyltransferase